MGGAVVDNDHEAGDNFDVTKSGDSGPTTHRTLFFSISSDRAVQIVAAISNLKQK